MFYRVPQRCWTVTEIKLTVLLCHGRIKAWEIFPGLIYFKEMIDVKMAWVYLLAAGVFEIVWALGLKYSEGFTKLVPSVVTIIGTIISFYLLSLAVRTLPIGTAYAIWTGIGVMGTVIWGIVFLGDSTNVTRLVFLTMIVIGILGLKFTAE